MDDAEITRVSYSKKRVVNFDRDGFEYLGSDGVRRHISFEECRKNWADFVNTSGEFKNIRIPSQETSCIAWRDYFAKPPYIEFFSKPHLRVEFTWTSIFPRKKFQEMVEKINALGWKTYDCA